MRWKSRLPGAGAQLPVGILLSGCSGGTAPTLSLFGAYFPIWILCAIVGVMVAAGTRLLLVVTGLSEVVPAQLLVCAAVGLMASCLTWLWLGQ